MSKVIIVDELGESFESPEVDSGTVVDTIQCFLKAYVDSGYVNGLEIKILGSKNEVREHHKVVFDGDYSGEIFRDRDYVEDLINNIEGESND